MSNLEDQEESLDKQKSNPNASIREMLAQLAARQEDVWKPYNKDRENWIRATADEDHRGSCGYRWRRESAVLYTEKEE